MESAPIWQGQQAPPGQPNPQDAYASSAPEPPRRAWSRATVTAVAASAAVVVACGVTGFLVLRDDGGGAGDGKAVTFAFKNAGGDFVSWTHVGAHGVPDEVPDTTIRQILGTVRLFEEGDGQT